ncbi:MFS transporter, partial [Kitasatospora sp. NPDC093558]|uniref:MFS transporter n=1 Tax=Kitasatospora sp. NPDC093558 TaxID=3155201 RepID=UPI0034238502
MRVERAWLALAVLMLPTLLVAMDVTALLLALPRLSADLGATNVQQLWISDGYGLTVAALVITMGTLGDRIGRRRLLLTGAAAFAVLSVVAAFATDPLTLIVVRALLGVAGATLAPSTLALITNLFRDGRQRGRAIAV